ncbi:hypothetical protein FB451DRAFT_1224378 [Mycena latifolia]|nr:hypothetical protein FB451DRAFT_1224378 [Mycena latifolia]
MHAAARAVGACNFKQPAPCVLAKRPPRLCLSFCLLLGLLPCRPTPALAATLLVLPPVGRGLFIAEVHKHTRLADLIRARTTVVGLAALALEPPSLISLPSRDKEAEEDTGAHGLGFVLH